MLIQDRFEKCTFSNSERVVIDFILNQKMDIQNMTTKEIGEATYTAPVSYTHLDVYKRQHI